MNALYVIINYVGTGGMAWTPRNEPFINEQTMEVQYSNCKFQVEDKENLLIEKVACEGGKTWVYYEYQRYDIMDTADRFPSFYSINLVTDSLCTDIPWLLCLFRTSFDKYIVGTGLTPVGNKFKVVASADAALLCKKVEDFFVKILGTYRDSGLLSEVPCTPITQQYRPLTQSNERQVLTRVNTEDITATLVQSVLASGKKLAVSDQYASRAMQHFVDEKERLNVQLSAKQTQLVDTQNLLATAKKQNAVDKAEIDTLKQKVNALTADVDNKTRKIRDDFERQKKEYEEKLKKYSGTGNYSTQQQLDKIVALLEAPQRPQNPTIVEKPDKKLGKLTRTLIAWIGIVLICINTLLLCLSRCEEGDKEEEDVKQEQYFDYNKDNNSQKSEQQSIMVWSANVSENTQGEMSTTEIEESSDYSDGTI